MAVPVIEEYVAGTDLGTDPIAVTLSSTFNSGLGVVFVITGPRSVSSVPSGWTEATFQSAWATSLNAYAYTKSLVSGDASSSLSFGMSSTYAYSAILALRVSGAGTVDSVAGTFAGSASIVTHQSVTTSAADCLVLRCFLLGTGRSIDSTSGDAGTSYYAKATGEPRIHLYQTSKATAGSTGTATYTLNAGSESTQITLAIAPTVSSVVGPVLFHSHFRSQGW
jgi:hypothetical protein